MTIPFQETEYTMTNGGLIPTAGSSDVTLL